MVCHRPQGECLAAVLFIHSLAEEMNKSRRMVALQSRALAMQGVLVLALDLHGCGDSDGDFGDATWPRWMADVQAGLNWLRSQTAAPLWAWGLRSGCLLVAESTRLADPPQHVLMWQPPASGKQMLQQFLRLRAALHALDGQGKGVVETVRRTLASGEAVDIAGYLLSPGLAAGLEAATLAPGQGTGHAWFLEHATEESDSSPGLVLQRTAQQWRDAGWDARSKTAPGPAFWQTTEIETAPAWLKATCDALRGE